MLSPGDTFQRYTIDAVVGEGGMGTVYRATDAKLGRKVALKVIVESSQDPAANTRLLREARMAAALDHPNVVSIFDVGEANGHPYIVMELVQGRSLRALVGQSEVSLETRMAHLIDVGRALEAAHRRGLVHRDVKPENVMVRDDGVVKVLDFGIARRAAGDVDPTARTPALATLTVEGIKVGTPVYMAPEQIKGGALDGRTDEFAWGVVAYELLTGRLPWTGSDALSAMASALTDPVERAPLDAAGVPRRVQDVVLRALNKAPEDRFDSMQDAVVALQEALATTDDSAPPAASETAAQKFSTGEVREVLARAVERQAAKSGSTKLTFDDLLAVADEAGIDSESLREASRALRAQRREPEARALVAPPAEATQEGLAWVRRQRRDFYRHAGIYVIVNAALLVLGLAVLTFTPWWLWVLPLIGWGTGLAIHGLVALTNTMDDWREHKRGMDWWLEHGRQRHEERMAALGTRGPRHDRHADRSSDRRERRAAAHERKRVDARQRVDPSANEHEIAADEEADEEPEAEEFSARPRSPARRG